MKSSIKLWDKLGRLFSLRSHVVWFYPSKFQIFLPYSKIYRTKIVNRKCWRCSFVSRRQQFLGGLKMCAWLNKSCFANWILQKQLGIKTWQKKFKRKILNLSGKISLNLKPIQQLSSKQIIPSLYIQMPKKFKISVIKLSKSNHLKLMWKNRYWRSMLWGRRKVGWWLQEWQRLSKTLKKNPAPK